jgi:hypothetical protein
MEDVNSETAVVNDMRRTAAFRQTGNIFVCKRTTMTRTVLLLALTYLSLTTNAQAYEDKVQYDKKKQPAIAMEYSFSPEAVENAIVEKFRQLGYKPKEEKGIFNSDRGFMVFKNAYISDISNDRMDYVIKVDRKSRKESDESVVYMIMLTDDQNRLEKMDRKDINRAKSFLNDLLPQVEAADLELQIKSQEELVSKTEKKLKTLQDEKAELERRQLENQKGQEQTVKDITTQKQQLDSLKGRRKG